MAGSTEHLLQAIINIQSSDALPKPVHERKTRTPFESSRQERNVIGSMYTRRARPHADTSTTLPLWLVQCTESSHQRGLVYEYRTVVSCLLCGNTTRLGIPSGNGSQRYATLRCYSPTYISIYVQGALERIIPQMDGTNDASFASRASFVSALGNEHQRHPTRLWGCMLS